jgi:cytochrome c oxidase subunit 1
MKAFISEPHLWFLLVIPFFYGTAFLYSGNTAVDIQLHDTMFVIEGYLFYLLPCLLFFLWGFLFYLSSAVFNVRPKQFLSILHFFVTIAYPGIIVFYTGHVTYHPNRYYTYANFESFNNFVGMAEFIAGVFLLFAIEQLLFFCYLLFLGVKSVARQN